VLFVIGDVAGHGLEAASAMGQIRTALRVIALDEQRPSGTLTMIDRYLTSEQTPIFATMLALRCDPGTGACVAASAGHLPVVAYGDEPTINWIATGPPLGSGIRAKYADSEFAIEPGTTLFLYTDGLVERRGEALDEGLARLVEVLGTCERGSEALAKSVVDALCGSGPMQDDVAVLALRRLPIAPVFELTVPAEPARLGSIRNSLRRWLGGMEVDMQTTDDVVLAVGELATNVCLHAYPTLSTGPLHIVGRREHDVLAIEVRDEGRWRSEPSPSGGRGLPLLGSLGFDISLDRSEAGTTARLRVDLDADRSGGAR
jgi:anti-sigma regulatory factor (Ser/Thr protein kinase)